MSGMRKYIDIITEAAGDIPPVAPETRRIMAELLGEKFGEGTSRAVHAHRTDPSLVFKVPLHSGMPESGIAQNMTEWEVWEHASQYLADNWLAPCTGITPDSRILTMKRTGPITAGDFPAKLPRLFNYCDPHVRQFGMLAGRAVCHDYGAWIDHPSHYLTVPALEQLVKCKVLPTGDIAFENPLVK